MQRLEGGEDVMFIRGLAGCTAGRAGGDPRLQDEGLMFSPNTELAVLLALVDENAAL